MEIEVLERAEQGGPGAVHGTAGSEVLVEPRLAARVRRSLQELLIEPVDQMAPVLGRSLDPFCDHEAARARIELPDPVV